MKIGIDIRTLLDREYSGVAEYTYNLLKELFRLDKNNSYTLFYNSARAIDGRIPVFEAENVKVVHTRYPNKLFNNIQQRLIKRPQIDSLLGVDVFFMPNIGFISLSAGCRKLLTVHDLSYLRYPEFYSLKRRAWHWLMRIRSMMRRFDRIIAVSENTRRDLIELAGVSPEKISVVPSGISRDFRVLEAGDAGLNRVRRKYSLPERFILFLGTLEPRKNIDGLIRAFELYCAVHNAERISLVIAGGRGWKNAAIHRAAQASPVRDRIKFIGYVDRGDKVYLYNAASLFVFPSFYEGFGFPPLEAMACGVPVVVSDNSSLPEIAGQAALAVNPFDSGAIAGAITSILADHGFRAKLAAAGLARSPRFNWGNTAKHYLELFTGEK